MGDGPLIGQKGGHASRWRGPADGHLLQRRYRVAARIASGGMGTVFRGHDERLDRDVAIKLLHAHLAEDDEVHVRCRDEARHAAKVRHHNVVAVLDQDEHDGLPCTPWRSCTATSSPKTSSHDRDGDVRVADFGIARALDSTRLTPAGTLLDSRHDRDGEGPRGAPSVARGVSRRDAHCDRHARCRDRRAGTQRPDRRPVGTAQADPPARTRTRGSGAAPAQPIYIRAG
ncbi:MAG: hypothetical protein KY460_14985 [Actinobacteria bacterium]|nr:hypothetical protein [Actinomycetota bacterium]